MSDKSFEAEQRYDHLDDLGQFDAATIREMSGHETDGENEDFTAEAIAARTGNIILSQVVETSTTEEPVVTPHDDSHQEWIEGFNLSFPTNEFPDGIPRRTADERTENSANIQALKDSVSSNPTIEN